MDPLRAAPGADIVLAAVAGEPGVHVVGGAVRDALRGQVPRELDLVVEGDAVSVARRAAERVGGEMTVHERFGTATVRTPRLRVRPRRRAPRELRAPGRAADRRAGRDDRGGPGAPRLHRQRDRGQPRRPARSPNGRARARTSTPASCACSTTARSSTTRRGCCGWCATPRGWTSRSTRHTEALIDPALLDTVSGDRAGNELRLLLRRAAPRARAARALRAGPGAARRALRSQLARRARRTRGAGPRGVLRPRSPVKRSPPASTTSGSRGRTEMSSWPRRTASSAFTVTWTARDAEVWRLLRRERVETVRLLAAAGDEGAQRWLEPDPPPQARDLGRRPDRQRPDRGRRWARAWRARWRPCSTAARRTGRPAGGGHTVLSGELFRWENEQLVADLPHARAVFSTARGGVSNGPFDVAEPRAADRRRARERGREPAPAGGGGRASVVALLLRAPGARRDRPARHRAAVRAAALHARGRPGDRADRRRRDRLRRRLPAGPARRRRRGRRAALRLEAAGGEHRRRGHRGAARGRRDRADHRRARPGRARLLLRGRRGGPRALRGLRRAPRRAQPRPRGGRRRSSSRRTGIETARRRAVHDLRRALLLATAATRASPAARRGSYAAPDHRPRRRRRSPPTSSGCRETIADAGRDPATVDILAAVKYVAARGDRHAAARPG